MLEYQIEYIDKDNELQTATVEANSARDAVAKFEHENPDSYPIATFVMADESNARRC